MFLEAASEGVSYWRKNYCLPREIVVTAHIPSGAVFAEAR